MKINFITFGCPKNTYYTQAIIKELTSLGNVIVYDPEQADIIVVNTCGFIRDAKKESIDGLYEVLNYRDSGKKVVALGCLMQRYSKEFEQEMPELDGILGILPPEKAANEIIKCANNKIVDVTKPIIDYSKVVDFTQTYPYSYLLIADGCNHRCAYCAIPFIKGKYVSRPENVILQEAQYLIENGEKELILVAQDTTEYGRDLKLSLPSLLKKLDSLEGNFWIRIMYAYPDKITDELIDTIKNSKHILHYLDIPFQHSSKKILRLMRRPIINYSNLISKLRKEISDITIRSTFIVGFPGETEDDFENLRNFLDSQRLDRAGIFVFSREEGTESYSMPNQVNYGKRLHRKKELMLLQRKISKNINENFVGRTLKVLVEQEADGYYIGRSYRDAPEIDGYIIFESDTFHDVGDFVDVKINEAYDYDLKGVEV
jgi:ribosomal protein S12 methylthiotransferase